MPRITGGCLCGAVRYSIDGEPIPDRQFLCHCVDCQKHTGTAFISGIAFPADSVVVTGPTTTFTMPGGQSGEPINRRFCHSLRFANHDRQGRHRSKTYYGGHAG